jgi:hypothetical protein
MTLNTVKIKLIDFLSEYYFLIVALFILGIYLSPNIFFQNNAHFLIHDNLDSNVVWYKNLIESGTLFDSNQSTVPNSLGGLPRGCYPSEFNVIILLFWIFPPLMAYNLNIIILHVVAFFSMYVFSKAFIFKNPMFQRSRDDNGILDEIFFGRNTGYDEFCKIAKIKFEDLFVRGGPKSLFETNREFGINLSLVTYMRLHEALEFYKNKKSNEVAGPAVSIKFFMKTLRPSGPPRRCRQHQRINPHGAQRAHPFARIIG